MYAVHVMPNSTNTQSAFPVFATVFCEGRSQPVFQGVTEVPLVTEPKFRNFIKRSFAQVRKVGLCLLAQNTPLGAARPKAPSFFERAGGVFHFSLEEALAPAKALPTRAPKKPAKKRVKAATRVTRKKILRLRKTGHNAKRKRIAKK